MTTLVEQIVPVPMPQINVNDEEVTLVGWRAGDGESVNQGHPLAEVETSKSVDEIPAPASGVVRQVARTGDRVRVGEVFAYLGPSVEAIDAHLAARRLQESQEDQPGPRLTAGAAALARRYGLDPARLAVHGGTVRREDIERWVCGSEASLAGGAAAGPAARPGDLNAEEALPPALLTKVGEPDELLDHQWAVAQHLSRARARLVPTHVAMDVAMDRVVAWVEERRKTGVMTGPLPLLLWATAGALKACPRLASFRLGRRVYAYRSIDVAFAARDRDGRLFAPVVRDADRLSVEELIDECARLTMGLFRGQLRAEEVAGGCITVSMLDQQPVLWHVGLHNAYQSAILTVGAIREQVVWQEGRAAPQRTATWVLSYDHGLLDGWEASAFLDGIRGSLEGLKTPGQNG